MMINQIIVKEARKWENYRELKGNQGWEDLEFDRLMKELTSWELGQAWCMYFVELVYKRAYSEYNSLVIDILEGIFSGSVVHTWRSFKRSPFFDTGSEPKEGAIAIWQKYKYGKPHWTGHTGIVIEWENEWLTTIDGNTNTEGGREGVEVGKVTRPLNFNDKEFGLCLQGFVYPEFKKEIIIS